jgi:hypothetical protein
MKRKVRFLGLDVHAETIAVAIAEAAGEVRSLGTIANREESIRKLVKKLGPVEELKACYEAGPTGYVLYWQLAELGVACEVICIKKALLPRWLDKSLDYRFFVGVHTSDSNPNSSSKSTVGEKSPRRSYAHAPNCNEIVMVVRPQRISSRQNGSNRRFVTC